MGTQINLTADGLRLHNYSGDSAFQITTLYNNMSNSAVDIRGPDELYALQYLVNRAIRKLELAGAETILGRM